MPVSPPSMAFPYRRTKNNAKPKGLLAESLDSGSPAFDTGSMERQPDDPGGATCVSACEG